MSISNFSLPVKSFEVSYQAQRVVVPVDAQGDDLGELQATIAGALVAANAAADWLTAETPTGIYPAVVINVAKYDALTTVARSADVVIYLTRDGVQTASYTITITQRPCTKLVNPVRILPLSGVPAADNWWYSPNQRDGAFARAFAALWNGNSPGGWLAFTGTSELIHLWRRYDGNIAGVSADLTATVPNGTRSIPVWFDWTGANVLPTYVFDVDDLFPTDKRGYIWCNRTGSTIIIAVGPDEAPLWTASIASGEYAAQPHVGDYTGGRLVITGGGRTYNGDADFSTVSGIAIRAVYDDPDDENGFTFRFVEVPTYNATAGTIMPAQLENCVPSSIMFPAAQPEQQTFTAPISGTWFGQVGGGAGSVSSVFRPVPTPQSATGADWLTLASGTQYSTRLTCGATPAEYTGSADRVASVRIACALISDDAAQISYAAAWIVQTSAREHYLRVSPVSHDYQALFETATFAVAWRGVAWSVRYADAGFLLTGTTSGGNSDDPQSADLTAECVALRSSNAPGSTVLWLSASYTDDYTGQPRTLDVPVQLLRNGDAVYDADNLLPLAEILAGDYSSEPIPASAQTGSVLWSVSAAADAALAALADGSTFSAVDTDGNTVDWIADAGTSLVGYERDDTGAVVSTVYRTDFAVAENTAAATRSAVVSATVADVAVATFAVVQSAAATDLSGGRTGVITLTADNGDVVQITVTQAEIPAGQVRLTVSPTSLAFTKTGGTGTVEVSTNADDWEFSVSGASTFSAIKTSDTTLLVYTAARSDDASDIFAGTITITADGVSRTVQLTQTGTPWAGSIPTGNGSAGTIPSPEVITGDTCLIRGVKTYFPDKTTLTGGVNADGTEEWHITISMRRDLMPSFVRSARLFNGSTWAPVPIPSRNTPVIAGWTVEETSPGAAKIKIRYAIEAGVSYEYSTDNPAETRTENIDAAEVERPLAENDNLWGDENYNTRAKVAYILQQYWIYQIGGNEEQLQNLYTAAAAVLGGSSSNANSSVIDALTVRYKKAWQCVQNGQTSWVDYVTQVTVNETLNHCPTPEKQGGYDTQPDLQILKQPGGYPQWQLCKDAVSATSNGQFSRVRVWRGAEIKSPAYEKK